MGRPALSDDEKRAVHIAVYLTEEQATTLREYARRVDKPASLLASRVVAAWLETLEKEPQERV